VDSANAAIAAIDAGADLVQLWTGMVYAGPGLIGDVVGASISPGERNGEDQGPPSPRVAPGVRIGEQETDSEA
jgi:hypothetical protein